MTLLKRATIKSYDAGSHRAAVGISGSLSVWLDGIALSDSIPAAAVVAGRECAILFHDDDNPDDAVIVSVHGGGPPGGGGGAEIVDGDGDTKVQTDEGGGDDDKIRFDTAGTERAFLDSSGRWKWNEPFGHAFGTATNLSNIGFNYAAGGVVSTGIDIWAINPVLTINAANKQFNALNGNMIVISANQPVLNINGLNFGVIAAASSGTPTITKATAVTGAAGSLFAGGAPTITDLTTFRAVETFVDSGATYTRQQGFWADLTGQSVATTVAALRITDVTAGTNKYLMWAGPNVPSAAGLTNLRLDAGNPPNAAKTDEGDSQLHLTFMENGSLVMRQFRWRHNSKLGASDKVLIAQ